MLNRIMLSAALVLTCASSMAFAASPTTLADTNKGKVLADTNGMTLYTFSRDSAGKSACNADCSKAWPPLAVSADAKEVGEFSVVVRDDGSRQWAYKGMPLYTWSKDAKPGDTKGDGFKDVWHVARP